MYQNLEQYVEEKVKELQAMDLKSPYDSSLHTAPLILLEPFLRTALRQCAELTWYEAAKHTSSELDIMDKKELRESWLNKE